MAANTNDTHEGVRRPSDWEEGGDASRKGGRARVSRACNRCRSRKDRCDGGRPRCANCSAAGQSCIYMAGHKKRGLPEGYVRGLEKLWAIMMQKVHGLDTTVRRVVDTHEAELLRVWNHRKFGDELHTTWKESTVLADLEKLLSRVDHPAAPDLKRKRVDEDDDDNDDSNDNESRGSRGATPPDRFTPTVDFEVVEASRPDGRMGLGGAAALASSRPRSPSLAQPRGATVSATATTLPATASRLLDHYFVYTHVWFPVLSRPYTLKRFYGCTRPQPNRRPAASDLAFLWAICAYSEQQMKPPPGDRHPRPTTGLTSREMHQIAWDLIPSPRGPFTREHVHALLLLTLLDIGEARWTSAWISIGLAVRAMLELIDLHQNLALEERATLQGCFILDTLVALRLGRIPHLRAECLTNAPLLDEDGREEWEPWGPNDPHDPAFAISTFNRLTQLSMVANDMCARRSPRGSDSSSAAHLHRLSLKYPCPAEVIEHRPPHHLLLQAFHHAILHLTGSDPARPAHPAPRPSPEPKKTFTEILAYFDRAWNMSDKCGIPSILAALYEIVQQPPGQPTAPSLPAGSTSSADQLHVVASSLSQVWSGFGESRAPPPAQDSSAPVMGHSAKDFDAHLVNAMSFSVSPQAPSWPGMARPYQGSDPRLLEGADPTAFSYDNADTFGSAMEPTQREEPVSMDYGMMGMDETQHSFNQDTFRQRGLTSGTATSPSFDGDEIDALFHEMAQLDTTEWSMDRMQGLKDFGFADDSTFQAFCNDPARLVLSGHYNTPTFDPTRPFSLQARPVYGSTNARQGPAAKVTPVTNFDLFGEEWQP